jgi:hypothetical protein
MKLKAFLERINKQGKINNEDFTKALEKITDDSDLPDVWVNLFEESFLTRERAVADFDIVKKIKAETLNGVDERLKGIHSLLDATGLEEFQKETNTFKKVESVINLIPKLLDKVKTEHPNNDERVKKLEKDLKEFADKLVSEKQAYEASTKDLQQKHEDEKSNLKLQWTFDKKLGEYVLADEFGGIKSEILKNIVGKVMGENSLQLDDKGQIVVVDIDPATKTAKPKFKGNEPVTIDSLLAEPLKPFLKKNNAGDDKGGQQQQQQPRQQQQRIPGQQNSSDSNLDRRRSARQNAPV